MGESGGNMGRLWTMAGGKKRRATGRLVRMIVVRTHARSPPLPRDATAVYGSPAPLRPRAAAAAGMGGMRLRQAIEWDRMHLYLIDPRVAESYRAPAP